MFLRKPYELRILLEFLRIDVRRMSLDTMICNRNEEVWGIVNCIMVFYIPWHLAVPYYIGRIFCGT